MKEKSRLDKIEDAIRKIASYAVSIGSHSFYKEVCEILNPPDPNKFMECDTCRVKSGSLELCKGCLHNRTLIDKLQ